MVSPGPFHVQRADLEAFLLAEIGTEPSGMPLTVLSMLARCGEDAWEKAGHLATLRGPVATNELARIILQSQTRTGGIAEATAIATRLVPLLPSQADASNSAGKLKPGASGIGWAGAALLCWCSVHLSCSTRSCSARSLRIETRARCPQRLSSKSRRTR